jgi:hypothetical protein
LHSLSRLLDFINRLDHGGVDWLRSLLHLRAGNHICGLMFQPAFILGLSTISDSSSLELVRRDLGDSGETAPTLSCACGVGYRPMIRRERVIEPKAVTGWRPVKPPAMPEATSLPSIEG